MSYSYQNGMPANYNMPYGNQEIYVQNNVNKSSGIGAVATGTAVGAAAGGLLGYFNNPLVSKNGVATDKFTKKVYETYIKKGTNPLQKSYEQGNTILNKIDKTKTVSELKDLFNSNKEATETFCNELKISIDEYFKNITDSNLSQNKEIIKDRIKNSNKLKFQNIKNDIQACWRQKNKTFEKASNVSQELFDSIKEASKGLKTKSILMYAAIAGVVGGILGFIGHKLIDRAKTMPMETQGQTIQQ